MESIVNPSFIYLLSVVGAVKGMTTFLAGAFFIIGASCCVVWFAVSADGDSKDCVSVTKWLKKTFKFLIPLLIFSWLFSTFVPSQKTLIAMYVANEITYNRVGKAGEIAKDLKDELKRDVMDILGALDEKEKGDKSANNK